jgi:hypothetical protein
MGNLIHEEEEKKKKKEKVKEDEAEREETKKTEVPISTVSEALEDIRVVNCSNESRTGNSRIVSQIMDIEEHLENCYWARPRRQLKIMDCVKTGLRL